MQRKDHVIVKESTATVPTKDLELWMAAFRAAGFEAHDVGDRLTTDDGLDAEATLAVTLRVPAEAGSRIVLA